MRTILIALLLGSVGAVGADAPLLRTNEIIPPVAPAVLTNGVSAAPVLVTSEFIAQLGEELRTNSPSLAAASARTNAAARSVAAVRTWEDPMAKAGYMFSDDPRMMRADDGDLLYGVEQKLPLWGKPQAMRRMAQAELGVAVADGDLRFETQRSELAKALFRAALVNETVRIGELDLAWVEKMREAADARYRSGGGSLTDVLRLQNEQARRADQLLTARAQLRQEEFTLNRMLNRAPDSAWPRLALPAVGAPVIYSEKLVKLARDYEPRLRKMRGEVRVAEAAVDKARRERLPEVSIGADTRNDSSNGNWRQTELMVSFSLPWLNRGRYRADLAREESRRQAAELDVADMELAVREEVHGLTVKIDAARREALLYRDEILPRSEQALEVAQSAWQNGSGMFLDVLEARRMLLEARLMSARAVAEQWQMLSELVLCCGLADFGALEMIGVGTEYQPGGKL